MASLTESKYAIIAGENGRRSGLAVAAFGSVELRVLVLPKMWRSRSQSPTDRLTYTCETLASGKVSVSIVCHEGDEFVLTSSALQEADWGDVSQCCKLIAERAEQLATTKRHRRSALVRLSAKTKLPTPEASPAGSSAIRCAWRQFLCLWNRVPDDLRSPGKVRQDFGDVSTLETLDSLLAPLVRREFVKRVDRVIHHARPGYTRVTRSSRFIRGSMNITSAAIAVRGGRDTVVCTYDAFGLDTPLLRVIAAALRLVAEGDATGDLPTAPEAIADARWLIGKLSAVQYVPRVAAARLGRVLLPRLSRLDSDWWQALRYACLVLDGAGIEPIPGPEDGALGWHDEQAPCYVFDVNTASLWEWMVREAWPSATPSEKGVARFAWERDSTKRGMQVDLVSGTEIADAKYRGWEPVPPAAEKRQAFTYSHLYNAKSVFWVYAKPCKSCCRNGVVRRRVIYWGDTDYLGSTTLRTIAAAFPCPTDAEDDVTWNDYLRRLRKHLSKARRGCCP